MDRVAVFVDAGYLYAGGAKSITGVDGTRRHEITLDVPAVLSYLATKAEALSQQKLLRIYWYDAAPSSRLTTDHQILASSDNVKLRLGVINGFGQQKGVDGKIITDLTELSRNRAFADAVLLGGDEDLRIGVELCQEYGARVHLLTIEHSSSSPALRQESDTVTVIAQTDIQSFLAIRNTTITVTGLSLVAAAAPPAASFPASVAAPTHVQVAPTVAVPPVGTPIEFSTAAEAEVNDYIAALSPSEVVGLTAALKTGAGVPVEHDGRILARTRRALGRPLDQQEKARLRRILKRQLGV